ncbi:unnamed protein product [Rhizophagus irregularis]|nr:unnamed protein product [Rhizophagus irregularis]
MDFGIHLPYENTISIKCLLELLSFPTFVFLQDDLCDFGFEASVLGVLAVLGYWIGFISGSWTLDRFGSSFSSGSWALDRFWLQFLALDRFCFSSWVLDRLNIILLTNLINNLSKPINSPIITSYLNEEDNKDCQNSQLLDFEVPSSLQSGEIVNDNENSS